MKHLTLKTLYSTVFTACISLVALSPVQAAPGTLSNIPLFVAAQVPPNIFFMLDDSGSMHWSMPTDGVGSSAIIELNEYDTIPDDNKEWRQWCPGANLMAYDPTITYKPWAANKPGTSTPFPDMTDITNVWVNPLVSGSSIRFQSGENNVVEGHNNAIINLSAAPVVTWTDTNLNGTYDPGECPGGDATTGYTDPRVQRADSLPTTDTNNDGVAERTNFANWFSYYRIREHATKAAVTQVVATTSARVGMATLHGNNSVGTEVTDMSIPANKTALLDDVVNFNSGGGTPLRSRLDWVGQYFDKSSGTPSGLNIGSPSSPILSAAGGGECQQNFAMLMTDGQWNGSSSVGHQDQTVDNNFVYPAHSDNTADTLGDIAMKWYKTDLATSLTGKVAIQTGAATQNLDENNQQHLVTFGVAFGPSGTLSASPTDRTAAFTWPAPSANASTTVDDLRHASYNGRGLFLSASNPQTLVVALQNVISDIESRQGSAAAVSFNSTSLSSNSALFFASFDTTDWKGNLEAFGIDPNTGNLSTSTIWNAANQLDARTDADMINNRVIYTWGNDSSGSLDGTLFNWQTTNPKPLASIVDDFKTNPDTPPTTESTPFTLSQNRLNFVRGDTSNEGGSGGLIRTRASRLGDIIHSAPFFVGPPISNWPDASPFGNALYSTYQGSLLSSPRTPMVYVGANDGMLHGFNANTGQEIFAYTPSSPASTLENDGLHYLTESDYGHKYYVDGSPIAADVYMRSNPTGPFSWRTVLIGGLSGGGQGYYALDVSNPTNFLNNQTAAAETVLWEFTNQHDADLGFTYSDPQITMMNNNKWAVVFGNGYNASGTDNAKLFILFIEQGIDGAWTLGTDYIKLDTLVGTPTIKNGLSTPTLVDLDGNGTTDRIYAGDLVGNMWAFDVSNTSSSSWVVANTVSPLFSASPNFISGTGTNKPITMKPLVVKPSWITDTVSNAPNHMVYFGTGQYISTGDAANTDQQTFYGIWDSGTPASSSNLVQQTLTGTASTRTLSANTVGYLGTDRGWFVDLTESGERVIVDAFELLGLVFVNTATPASTPCSAGGSSWRLAFDAETGGNPTINAFDTNNDGIIDLNDSTVAGIRFSFGIASATSIIGNYGYTSGTNTTRPVKTALPGGLSTGRRTSWKQLLH